MEYARDHKQEQEEQVEQVEEGPTRAKLLEQLRKRELFVPNAEQLPMHQLQHIYNGFIVPQPRRERRETRQHELPQRLAVDAAQQMQCITVVCVAGVKRRGHNDPEPLLRRSCSSAAKRRRIEQQP
ncbi:uncharacterized protein LOC6566223 isoform X1 [Drosophila grimshawi]|uniref:GH24458 n=1 Tax=Drosophila grimshawi TaxID=7222 RepID=B4JLT2_DROGR|nr:uncharacterized protein LOC6566223 isoform X1 [Drosophila grimshawi]EDV91693.1 GH24458 [Drosophila grimshawi]